MKKYSLLLIFLILGSGLTVNAQKWSDLSEEEKLMKLQSFREDNQNYLKNTLKLTDEQMTDIDDINLCYLATLDRISRYGKTDADKEKYAKSITAARSAQLDAIMGKEKRDQYAKYVNDKLKKAKASMQ